MQSGGWGGFWFILQLSWARGSPSRAEEHGRGCVSNSAPVCASVPHSRWGGRKAGMNTAYSGLLGAFIFWELCVTTRELQFPQCGVHSTTKDSLGNCLLLLESSTQKCDSIAIWAFYRAPNEVEECEWFVCGHWDKGVVKCHLPACAVRPETAKNSVLLRFISLFGGLLLEFFNSISHLCSWLYLKANIAGLWPRHSLSFTQYSSGFEVSFKYKMSTTLLLWNVTKNWSPLYRNFFLSCTKTSQLCCTASAHMFW